MSSYEEMVVDREVDAAWTTFRTRLADWLDDDTAMGGATFAPDPDDPHAPVVDVVRFDTEIGVFVLWGEHLSTAYARPAEHDVVEGLGFTEIHDELSGLCLDLDRVDQAACAVVSILRDAWGVPHPAFVEVRRGDDVPTLVDEPEPLVAPTPTVPDAFAAASKEDLQVYVKAHLQSKQEQPLSVLSNGDLPYGDERRRALVSVRTVRRVEVWSLLAADVRRKAARREASLLARRYPHHRFLVIGRRLIASLALDAGPLVAEHLDRGIAATVELHRRESDRLQERLARRPEVEPEPILVPAIDPVLLGLAGDARRMPMSDLVDLLLEACESDPLTITSWLSESRTARGEARSTAREAKTPAVRQVHVHAHRRWDTVVQALKVAAGRLDVDHGRAA